MDMPLGNQYHRTDRLKGTLCGDIACMGVPNNRRVQSVWQKQIREGQEDKSHIGLTNNTKNDAHFIPCYGHGFKRRS
eukprot:225869-Heterocapsa_arctica.AAC.1